MDKAPDLPCQPAYRPARQPAGKWPFGPLLLALCALIFSSVSGAESPATPTPAPPPTWKQELAALEVMRVAAAFSPEKRNAQGETLAEHTEAAFRQLGAKYPDQPEIQKACGDFFFDAGQNERAFTYWLRSQKLAPGDADLAASLGNTYLRLGNTREAAAQFQRAVAAQPSLPQHHTALGNVLYLFRGDLVEPPALPDSEAVLLRALEEFRIAADLSPKDRQLAQTYAEAFYILAKPDWPRALTAWQTVLALSQNDPDFAISHLARVSLRMKQPRQAENYLNQLQRPDFADVQAKLRAQARKMKTAP